MDWIGYPGNGRKASSRIPWCNERARLPALNVMDRPHSKLIASHTIANIVDIYESHQSTNLDEQFPMYEIEPYLSNTNICL